LVAPPNGAIVRMYCTGLGDCFLIGLPHADGKTGYVLIDCGVWKGTPGAREWMTRIMEHIKTTVGEHGIDVLVATHLHWDHLSGFALAREIFDSIPVKEVWLPWTEDETDPTALRLANERRLAIRAALAATAQLRAVADRHEDLGVEARAAAESVDQILKFVGRTPPNDDEARQEDAALVAAGLRRSGAPAVRGTDDFLGLVDEDLAAGELAAGPSTEDLMDIVRARVAKPRYLRPSSEALSQKAFPGVRIYALGPPTDPKFLGKDNPSTAPGKSEVYLGAASALQINEDSALLAAALPVAGQGQDADALQRALEKQRRELLFPFEFYERIPIDQIDSSEDAKFMNARHYSNPKEAWRRIDVDWLQAAEQLAINLDSHVNNTSLALAFELGTGDEAPVLLFPGDAQVGNWLSWHQLDKEQRFARSLLSRTVLYKVGHHASHNATLKGLGLELMTNTTRLAAMIPVDQVEAHKPKGSNKDGWDMPYGNLLGELLLRTEGRIMRADEGLAILKGKRPSGWSEEKWTLFVEDTKAQASWKQFVKDAVVHETKVTLKDQEIIRPFFIDYLVRSEKSD
jgi:hypothetical protein